MTELTWQAKVRTLNAPSLAPLHDARIYIRYHASLGRAVVSAHGTTCVFPCLSAVWSFFVDSVTNVESTNREARCVPRRNSSVILCGSTGPVEYNGRR